jgi:hypothetical protein
MWVLPFHSILKIQVLQTDAYARRLSLGGAIPERVLKVMKSHLIHVSSQ